MDGILSPVRLCSAIAEPAAATSLATAVFDDSKRPSLTALLRVVLGTHPRSDPQLRTRGEYLDAPVMDFAQTFPE